MSDELDESLEGYKGKINPEMKLTLTYEKDLIFAARTPRGYVIDYDARVEWGCMPTESLLASVTACMAIDVVSFLQKMRVQISDFKIDAVAQRNPTPPQYFTGIELLITITGKDIDPKKMDRAVALSKDKYCSVYHSLRKDLTYDVRYVIIEADKEPLPNIVEE